MFALIITLGLLATGVPATFLALCIRLGNWEPGPKRFAIWSILLNIIAFLVIVILAGGML